MLIITNTPSSYFIYLSIYLAINYYIAAKKTIEYLENPKHFRTFALAKENSWCHSSVGRAKD